MQTRLQVWCTIQVVLVADWAQLRAIYGMEMPERKNFLMEPNFKFVPQLLLKKRGV